MRSPARVWKLLVDGGIGLVQIGGIDTCSLPMCAETKKVYGGTGLGLVRVDEAAPAGPA